MQKGDGQCLHRMQQGTAEHHYSRRKNHRWGPFKIIGDVKQKHKDFWTHSKQLYVDFANDYPGKVEEL